MVATHRFAYNYIQATGAVLIIDTEQKAFTCSQFFDKVVCKHLTSGCIKDGVELFGLPKRPKRLAAVRRKQTKNKLDDSDAEDVEPPQVSNAEDFQPRVSDAEDVQPVVSSTETVKRGRDRPRKAEKALFLDATDMIEPLRRTSTRLGSKKTK